MNVNFKAVKKNPIGRKKEGAGTFACTGHMKKIYVYEKVMLSLVAGRNLARGKAMKKIYKK